MRERNHAIDGLRALAVSLVVFHHAFTGAVTSALSSVGLGALGPLASYTAGSGVELFFCISGIVLLQPYLRGERPFVLRTYVLRRVERLWPPYIAALVLASLVIAYCTAYPTWFSTDVLPRFRLIDAVGQIGFFLPPGVPTYNGAWWSLAVEIVFYAMAPLVVWWLRQRVMAMLVVAYIIGEIAWRQFESGVALYIQFATYLPCFAVGILVAARDVKLPVKTVLALALIQFAAWALIEANVHTAFALLYLALILAVNRPGAMRRAFSSHLAVWFGERSYSIFLVHFSALYFGNNVAAMLIDGRTVSYLLASRAIGLPLALIGALLVFHLVEKRFARGLVTANELLPLRRTATASQAA